MFKFIPNVIAASSPTSIVFNSLVWVKKYIQQPTVTNRGTSIDSHFAEAKDPIVQNFTFCIPCASLAIDIIKFEADVQSALITVPDKI